MAKLQNNPHPSLKFEKIRNLKKEHSEPSCLHSLCFTSAASAAFTAFAAFSLVPSLPSQLSLRYHYLHNFCFASAAFTTIAAFGSLTVSGILPVADFGWMMCIGIVVSFVTTYLFFPSALLLMPNTEPASNLGQSNALVRGMGDFVRWREFLQRAEREAVERIEWVEFYAWPQIDLGLAVFAPLRQKLNSHP